jgi:Helix-turn-helix domain/Ribosomal protein S14p/S29e
MSRGFSRPIAGVSWISEQLGLSRRQVRRLAVQGAIPGVYRSQKRGKWRVHKVEFLVWLERRKAK